MQKLYYNGDIITMEGEGQYAEAILVEDGLIKTVGTFAETERQKSTNCEVVDLAGKTLMPSFIDGHGHISLTAAFVDFQDLSSATTFAEIVTLLKDYKTRKNIQKGDIIVGYSYDHNFLKEEAHPTKDVLDQVSTENPILILHTSVHMGVVNSVVLNAMKINADTPNPDGGVLGRYADSNEPNGYVEEGALHLVLGQQNVMGGDAEKMLQNAVLAQDIYIENGITTVQDGASSTESIALYKGLDQANKLKVDVISYPVINTGGKEAIEANADCDAKYLHHFKIGGYKIVLDGSPQGRSAWLSKPYEGEETYCGYPWMKEEVVAKCMQQAVEDNRQLLCHCNGDAASDQLIRCYGQALAGSANPNKDNLRPVMIHCQTVRNDQLDEMAKMKMIPSIFVSHTYYWGDVHLKNLGKVRGNHISPVKDALQRGLIYNFHTDTPVVKPLMLHTVWAAVNRITVKGQVVGADQCVSVYDALKGITINAAYSYFEENSKGSIKAGKRADLVILDQNPLKVDKMTIKDIQVLETIKDGETVYQK